MVRHILFSLGLMAITLQGACADNLHKAWQQNIGGPLNLAPVVAHDSVYVVPEKGPLQVFDLHSGALKWQFDPAVRIWERGISIHGDSLLVCMEGGDLVSLNAHTGKVQWQVNLDGIDCQRPAYANQGLYYVSTTYVGPGLYGKPLRGAKLFAINPSNGDILWRHKSDGFLLQTVTSYGDTIYLGASYIDPEFQSEEGGPAYYHALDGKTGEVKWTHKSIYGLPKALYATAERLIYVAYEDFLVGLDSQTGRQIWQRDTENWVPSLVGQDDYVYFGSANTFVHAWHVQRGQIGWRYNVPGQSFEYLLVKPYLHNGVVYFMTQQGNVFALSQNQGLKLWSAPTGLVSRVDPTFAEGHLVVGDIDGVLTAFTLDRY